ncbi:peptidase [Streptococcus porcinus]|uniref:hypothetical protein n=1 Tax=Streptococcus porcinus TaxID=1340 RepID=UPI0010CAC041|nr:hypothetical protein [Streptococcus porcinus]VTS39270.1 peptidase [Streptococcus porcinus]
MLNKKLLIFSLTSASLLMANSIVQAEDISLPGDSTIPSGPVVSPDPGTTTNLETGVDKPEPNTDTGSSILDPGTTTDPGSVVVDPGTTADPSSGLEDTGTTTDPGTSTDPSSGTVDPGTTTNPGSGSENSGTTTNPSSGSGNSGTTTDPVVIPTPEKPIVTDTGAEIVSTQDSKVIIKNSDGSYETKTAEEIGGKTNPDGTVTINEKDGKKKTLPNTGTSPIDKVFSFLGVFVALVGMVFIKPANSERTY